MAIRYQDVVEKNILVKQISSRPLVYLDNWALNHFIQNECDQRRFIHCEL